MEMIALRSPGLPGNEISEALAGIGVTVVVVTSLDEAEKRQLSLAQIIIDGVGETAEVLQALGQIEDRIERIFWVGFEPPSVTLPGLCLIDPLNVAAGLCAAVQGPADAMQHTMVPIAMVPAAAPAEPGQESWDLAVEQPEAPRDRPPPTVAPMVIGFDDDDDDEEEVVEADFVEVSRRSIAWKPWARAALGVLAVGGVFLLWASQQLTAEAQIALPEPVKAMPTYTLNNRPQRARQETAGGSQAAPGTGAKAGVLIKKTQLAPATKTQTGTAVQFNPSGLQQCLRRLGKKGQARLKRLGKMRVTMRLGVMGDGRIAAATTVKVRMGRKKYRSKRFNACVEGEVVGQQLNMRPEREPTFIKRTFTLRR